MLYHKYQNYFPSSLHAGHFCVIFVTGKKKCNIVQRALAYRVVLLSDLGKILYIAKCNLLAQDTW